MNVPTLIPEAHSYGLAILVVFGLSSFSLALHIHSHMLAGKRIGFWAVYHGVMIFTVVWGILLFDIRQIAGNAPIIWVISIPLGIVAGWIAGWSDRTIIRYLLRRQLVSRNASMSNGRTDIRQTQNDWNLLARANFVPQTNRSAKRRTISLHKGQQGFQPSLEYQQFGLWSIILTAVLEEFIYRGLLVKVCFLLPSGLLIDTALVGVVLAFSLAHIQFGWPHVLAKLPLSILATIIALTLGTVLPAVVAHMVFNINIWQDKRIQPVFLGSHDIKS